jgi:short-subunit dehydrogenase
MTNIVLTGASSGIGAALAAAWAAPGVTFALAGRNAERLEATAEAVRAKGATAITRAFDIRDRAALADFVAEAERVGPIDLTVANAGILDGRRGDAGVEDGDTARAVIETNLIAAVDTIHAVLPGMRAAKRGKILLISSLSAFSPLPDAPAYSASKAGLLSYGLALREAVRADGITVSVACPGYVTTRMTETHLGYKPFEIDAETAARKIMRGVARGKAVIGFPEPIHTVSRLSAFVPEWLRRLGMGEMRFRVGERRD